MALISPSTSQLDPGCHLTLKLAERCSSTRFGALPSDIVELATQCLLDWMGVTIAGADQPAVQILFEEVQDQGGNPQATVIGYHTKASARQAALVNGTASHALDYDDVNWSLKGHPSAAIIPGLLALAEWRGAAGAEFITAFVAGYETACRIGRLVSPSHYRHGFHNTATIGAIGSAAACARLLGLNARTTAMALGIAATQAAGLKSMFGTMCKPLHAGKAAEDGLLAATLAMRGFESRTDVLECVQGFGATQSADFNLEAALAEAPGGYYLRANLFKYHAACYLTHAVIECCLKLRDVFRIRPEDVNSIIVHVDETLDGVCNIQEPKTGSEAKFSLRLIAAFAVAGIDTSSTTSYSISNCEDTRLTELRDKIRVEFVSGWPATKAEVTIDYADWLSDSRSRIASEIYDSGVPADNLAEQRERLRLKFCALVDPIFGPERRRKLVDEINGLVGIQNLEKLLGLCRRTPMDGA